MAEAPAGEVVDLHTRLASPSGGEEAGARLRALLARHGVAGAVALSTRALYYDAVLGNQETRDACAEGDRTGPYLLPAGVFDPRVLLSAPVPVEGMRLVCLFPATQGWPIDFAPLHAFLDRIRGIEPAPPALFWEAARPGDATAIGRYLGPAHTAPVVLAGVSGATLAEAVAVARDRPSVHIATDGLRGVAEVAAAVTALGAERVIFGSGTPARSLGAALALVRHAGLSPADAARVLAGNAGRLLGLGTSRGGAA